MMSEHDDKHYPLHREPEDKGIDLLTAKSAKDAKNEIQSSFRDFSDFRGSCLINTNIKVI